ncbi:MAG: glycosyltransferase [Betaproteobacteria bacterium]|nr:glycosyltransferase [Betaproteobacteria bacterium]
MKILFVHQNFPGQFKFLAPALVAQGHQVHAMLMNEVSISQWQGVHLVPYRAARGSSRSIHPWVADFETKTIRAEANFRKAIDLKNTGYSPDVIIAHPGWGESLFLKEVWPAAKLGIYCEFFYHAHGADLGFDAEFADSDIATPCRIRLKNLNNLMHFDLADAGLSPTKWQASTYPEGFRKKITVVHDGIDTVTLQPNPDATFELDTYKLTKQDEVITYVSRNLEPYRGFHVFMRALPALLKARPHAQIIVVGGDDVSYGSKPASGDSWRSVLTKEIEGSVSATDWQRVHFVGKLPYSKFIALLQVSTVHIYLTYPFVLSWSLFEAMSVGAAIIASDTAPVSEVIQHGECGQLINFFDIEGLVTQTCQLLDNPVQRQRMGNNAREHVRSKFDLRSVCLPKQLQWITSLS